jgi:hypothetical protein
MLCSHHAVEVHAFRAGLLYSDDNPENELEYELDARADGLIYLPTVKDDFTRDWSQRVAAGGKLRG